MKLKIIAPDVMGRHTKIFLDDKELTHVTDVDISLQAGSLNTATITFIPTEIEVEGEFGIRTRIGSNEFLLKLVEE